MTRPTIIEAEYLAAKTRLQAAQQEKLEAAAAFMEARAELRQVLETFWPSRCECGEEREHRGDADEQQRTYANPEEAGHRQVMIEAA